MHYHDLRDFRSLYQALRGFACLYLDLGDLRVLSNTSKYRNRLEGRGLCITTSVVSIRP